MSQAENLEFPHYPMYKGYKNIEETPALSQFFGPSDPAPILSETQHDQIMKNAGDQEGSEIIKSFHETYADKRAQIAAYSQQIPMITAFLGLCIATVDNPQFQQESIKLSSEVGPYSLLYFGGITSVYAGISLIFGRNVELMSKPIVDHLFRANINDDLQSAIHSEGLDRK